MSMYEQPLETHSFNLDSLSHDIHIIKQTLQGWTSIFSQLMDLTIQNSKQNQTNSALLHQLTQQFKKPKPKDQFKLSPIRPNKTEPDENVRTDNNFSKIFNNPKKISIMQLQGTPFDSAYESINKELEEPNDQQYMSVPKSMQMSIDLNKQRKNQEWQPQSAKNHYENKQFAFNAKVIRQANKENQSVQQLKPEQQQLSTVVEENQSPCMSPYEHNFRCNNDTNLDSVAQSHRQFEQCSTAKTSQNSQRPLNYFQQPSDNNRSCSKSCYNGQGLVQQQQGVLTNVTNQPNPFLSNLNNTSTKSMTKVQNNLPFKQQFEIMTQVLVNISQISNQRAKSYSEQNCKKLPSKRCLEIEFDKQYETSQELIWKAQKLKK